MPPSISAVLAIIWSLVPEITESFPDVRCLHYFTDSPTSQYRNKSMFYIVSHHQKLFGLSAHWDFFEAGHGKGPCDGLAGTSKHQAAEAVKQGKCNIQDAADFFAWATKYQKSITYIFYTKEDYKSAAAYLATIKLKFIQGTMKIHGVRSINDDPGFVFCCDTSCNCKSCLAGDMCDGWRRADVSETHKSQPVYKQGSHVAAVYEEHWYIGKILEADDTDDSEECVSYLISFMKSGDTKSRISFIWPSKEDVIWVFENAILCEFSEPSPLGRSGRLFSLKDADFSMVTELTIFTKG